MSKRFNGDNLLRADAFVGEVKRAPVVTGPLDLEQTNLCVKVSTALAKKLRIAAIEKRISVRSLVIKALEDAGYTE